MYLSWAFFGEGNSDRDYFESLLPRVLEDLALRYGTASIVVPDNTWIELGKNGRSIKQVAAEACAGRDAFQLLFIHADTGGRALEAGIDARAQAYIDEMHDVCGLRKDRAIILAPRHETEAWILADRKTFLKVLGFVDPHNDLDLPVDGAAAEKLTDPKARLKIAVDTIYGRRITAKRELSYGPIGQRQDLGLLRSAPSFSDFEGQLMAALSTFGIVKM